MNVIKNNFIMLKYIAKYCPWHIPLVIINSILSSGMSVLNLLYINAIIKSITESYDLEGAFILIILMLFFNMLSSFFRLLMGNWIIPRNSVILNQKMQTEIFSKIIDIDYEAFENTDFYNKLTGAAQQSDSRALAVLDTFANMIGNIFSIGALLTLISTFEPFILILVLINVVVNILIYMKSSKVNHSQYEESISVNRDLNYSSRIFYSQYFAKEIKLFQDFPKLLVEKFNINVKHSLNIIKKYMKKNLILLGGETLISLLIDSFTTLYLAYRVIKKYIGIADFITVSNGFSQLTSQMTQFAMLIPNLYEHSMYIENYKTFINYKPLLKDGNLSVNPLDGFNIKFNNVIFEYPSTDITVLNGINLEIKQNQKIAFVGRNGAGKTTLVKLICRLYDCKKGNIYLNDLPYSSYKINELREKISIVFQEINFFSFTIAENILMRPVHDKNEDEKIVINALIKVGLYDKVSKLPKGIYTRLTREFDEKGSFFSGGEYQKLIIARAFIKNSNILIFDEPSSSLDAISEREIFRTAMEIVQDKSLIFISHRLANIQSVDRIYYIENGVILEEGTHSELMKLNGHYAELYNVQADGYKENQK